MFSQQQSHLKQSFKLWLILATALICSLPKLSQAEPSDRAKLEALKATMAELKQELDKIKSNRSDLLSELENSESKIGDLNKQVEGIQKALQNKQEQLKELQLDKKENQQQKRNQQSAAAQNLRSAYQLGQQNHLKLLLNQQDPAQVARNMRYLDYIVQTRNQKIASYAQTVQKLNKLEPAINDAINQIENRRQSLNKRRTELAATQSERKRTLKLIESSIADADARLSAMEQDRAKLQKLVSRVVEATGQLEFIDSGKTIAQLKGQLPWPAQGRVLHNFGSHRVKGKLRWQGMLISAQAGEPVRAIHSGRVVFSDYLRGHGLLIIVDHGSGYLSLYAHNQALYKSIGEWVSANEQIASVGSSGGQDSASLYFELRYKGEPTNPNAWLKKA